MRSTPPSKQHAKYPDIYNKIRNIVRLLRPSSFVDHKSEIDVACMLEGRGMGRPHLAWVVRFCAMPWPTLDSNSLTPIHSTPSSLLSLKTMDIV